MEYADTANRNQVAAAICDYLQYGPLVRLGYGTDTVRDTCAWVQRQAPELIWNVALAMLHAPDPRHRLSGAEMLLRHDREHAVPLVIPLLSDPVEFVRVHVCDCLHDFGDARATAAVIHMLRNEPDGTTRFHAADTLDSIGDAHALPALEWVVDHDTGTDWQGRPVAGMAYAAIESIRARCRQQDEVSMAE